jgi:hypothetical protein
MRQDLPHLPVAEFFVDEAGDIHAKYRENEVNDSIGQKVLERAVEGKMCFKSMQDVKKYFCNPFSSLAAIEIVEE